METKSHSKELKTSKLFPIMLCIILFVGILGMILYFYSRQYNIKGISNIITVYIDPEREKTYVGRLNGYDIYVENIRTEESIFRTFNAKSIPLKDVIEKNLTSIKDWRRGAWYIFNDNGTDILRYESYEIAIKGNECIIRPISKYKSIDVKCHTDNVYRTTLKQGNKFECILHDKFYTFKVKNIYNDKIIVTASDYGLTKVQDNKIDLESKEKEFVIEKNKKVELSTQLNDYNELVIIEWY